jgi:Icc-related predicted phosphoesterase
MVDTVSYARRPSREREMKLLQVSDLHYRLRHFDWLAQIAGAVDVVVIAGDLLDIRSPVPLDAQAIAVSAAMRALGSRVLLLAASGNHDLDSRDSTGEKVARWLSAVKSDRVRVDGESLYLGDDLFTVCPWWDGPLGRAALGKRLAKAALLPRRRWIWVHHAPPSGSPLAWDGRREYGDAVLTGWISRFEPDIVLAGHVHQAPFVGGGAWSDRIGTTWIFNAGQQPGPVPTHVLIDLEAGTAAWISADDRAQISLDLGAAVRQTKKP